MERKDDALVNGWEFLNDCVEVARFSTIHAHIMTLVHEKLRPLMVESLTSTPATNIQANAELVPSPTSNPTDSILVATNRINIFISLTQTSALANFLIDTTVGEYSRRHDIDGILFQRISTNEEEVFIFGDIFGDVFGDIFGGVLEVF